MTVMKFGGSSIKNAQSIKEVFSIINKRIKNDAAAIKKRFIACVFGIL